MNAKKIIFYFSIVSLFYNQSMKAQLTEDFDFKNKNSEYVLSIYHNGTYSLHYNYDSEKESDILESDVISQGNWSKDSTIMYLQDTIFPLGNVNRKLYEIVYLNYHTLLIQSLPTFDNGDTLKLTEIQNNEEGWFFNGYYSDSKKNGVKVYYNEGYIENYIGDIVVKTHPIKNEE